MKKLLRIVFGCCTVFTYELSAQCSDAGVCSIGQHSEDPRNSISVTYQYGRSGKADDLTFHSATISADLHLFDDARLSVALPANSQSGPLGSVYGPGDLTILWTQTLFGNESGHLRAQLGGKFAIAENNAGRLPQAYQSGLGTNDLLIGVTFSTGEWSFTGAFQQPFGRSKNTVDRLKRGGDVMGAVGYTVHVESFKVGGDLLLIRRLSKSSVLSVQNSTHEVFKTIPGSAQTQVNLVGRASYPLSELTEIHGAAVVPLLKREVNVDGLTRSFSLSVGLSFAI